MGGGSLRVDIGGVEIAYERSGSGPPLVCLHGAFSDSRSWRRQLEDFADEFTVIAWDAPGFGNSADAPSSFTALADYANCLAGFVDALGLARPHVLGLSFGGGLALEVYRCHPDMPRSLVLAGAYAGWAGSLPPDEVARRLEVFERWTRLPIHEFVAEFLPQLLTPDASSEQVAELTEVLSDYRADGMRTMSDAFARADVRDVLARITVPTLILHGEHDVRAPRPVADALHAAIPGSRLVVLQGAGHESSADAPDLFNGEVRSFLQSVP